MNKEEIEEIENTLKVSKPYNELGTYNYFNCESIEKLLEENKSLQSQLKVKEKVIKEASNRINKAIDEIDKLRSLNGDFKGCKNLLEILSKGENK